MIFLIEKTLNLSYETHEDLKFANVGDYISVLCSDTKRRTFVILEKRWDIDNSKQCNLFIYMEQCK